MNQSNADLRAFKLIKHDLRIVKNHMNRLYLSVVATRVCNICSLHGGKSACENSYGFCQRAAALAKLYSLLFLGWARSAFLPATAQPK